MPNIKRENDRRAKRFHTALRAYACALGDDYCDDATTLSDMLSDAMHFCRKSQRSRTVENRVDFDDCIERANMHFGAETTRGAA